MPGVVGMVVRGRQTNTLSKSGHEQGHSPSSLEGCSPASKWSAYDRIDLKDIWARSRSPL